MLREIFAYIINFIQSLDAIGAALGIVNKFKNILRILVSWIMEVTRADDAVRKAKKILTKTVKAMKVEIKEAIKLSKEVARLKEPA